MVKESNNDSEKTEDFGMEFQQIFLLPEKSSLD